MVDNRMLFNTFYNINLCNNYLKNHIIITDVNNNNNNKHNKDEDEKPKYTKVFVENPYENRKVLLKITKDQKGVYV